MSSTLTGHASASPPEERARPADRERGGLWRNADFLKLWSGETVSSFGAQMTQLALPLLVLGVLKGTAWQVGLVSAMQYLPALCVPPFAGLVIDLFDRRLILLAANGARASALALVPVLDLTHTLSVPALCVIGFLVGAGTSAYDVAYLAYLPAVVPRRDIVEANSKLQGSYSVAQIGGASIGGLLIRLLGAWLAILANVVGYAAAFVLTLLIRHREPRREPAAAERPRLSDFKAGLALMWNDRTLRVLGVRAGWFNLCQRAIQTLFLVYAVQQLRMDAGGIGLVLALGSVASLGGAFTAKWAGRRFGFPGVLVLASFASSFGPVLLLPTGPGSPWNFTLSTLTFAVLGFGLTIYNVHVVAFRQSVIPAEVLGRSMAAYRMITYGTLPIGAVLGGVLGARLGLWNALLLFAIGSVAAWVMFVLACRTLPRSEPAHAE